MNEHWIADAQRAHASIVDGTLRGTALRERILAAPFVDRDTWLDLALALDAPPDDVPDLPRGAVPYVPCGVDAILHAVHDAPVRSTDVFVDLGAGVGRVAALVHLLTGARTHGVELQPHLVARSRTLCAQLRIADHVAVVHGDAASTLPRDGTVFFIYASFGQSVLRTVLEQLQGRRVTLCAVGFDVDVPWFRARPSSSPELTLYDSQV